MARATTSPVSVVADPRLREYDFGPGHPFQVASRWLAVRLLEEDGFFDGHPERVAIREVPMASREELLRFHREAYLDRVDGAGEGPRTEFLDQGDTPAFPGCYRAAARVAGATLAALAIVEQGGGRRAFQPAGGLHHAHPDRASGFCIFNDVALAVATAIGPGRRRRVAYIDVDAHHGDGVMYGFYDDGRLLDIDFHQDGRTIFPGTGAVGETGAGDGAGLKVNLPMPPGSGDRVFGTLFSRLVPTLVREFRPEVIVLQCGVDAHRDDALAQLRLTPASYELAVGGLSSLADEMCQGRLLVTGGGGYDAANVSRVLASVPRWLSGEHPDVGRKVPERWRAEFAETTGEPAPRSWAVAAADRPNDDPVAEALVSEIGSALGRKFPVGATPTR
jgi:acetoin utilization protein AcuC